MQPQRREGPKEIRDLSNLPQRVKALDSIADKFGWTSCHQVHKDRRTTRYTLDKWIVNVRWTWKWTIKGAEVASGPGTWQKAPTNTTDNPARSEQNRYTWVADLLYDIGENLS